MSVSDIIQNKQELSCKLHLPDHLPESTGCLEANRFRKIIMTQVPTLAIETVRIFHNTTRVYDEIISHRLSLIPFLSDILESEGEGVAKEITLSLDLTADQPSTLLSQDLVGPIRPAYDNIVICYLKPSQRIKLTAQLKKGTGEEHIKWSPVSNCTFEKLEPRVYKFQMKLIGNLSAEILIKRALDLFNSY